MSLIDRGVLKVLKKEKAKWDPNNSNTGGPKLTKNAFEVDNFYLINMLLECGFEFECILWDFKFSLREYYI